MTSCFPAFWLRVPIGDVCLGIFDGPHATPKPASDGAVFLGIKNITEDGRLDLSEIRYITEEDFPKWIKRVQPLPGDIVFTYEATLNRYAIIPEGFRGCLGRRLAVIKPDFRKVDNRFLFYYFFGEDWRRTIARNLLSGSTVDRIPISTFPTFEVSLPPLSTQKRIADILSAYDRLIENNTRRIKILEEMARSLYDEWFVKFRFPGHEQTKLVDSELGLIPEGWKADIVGNIGAAGKSIVSGPFGSNIGKRFFVDKGVPVIRGNNLTLGVKKFVDEGFVFITEEKAYELRNCEALPGDIIFTAAGTLGQIGLIPRKPKYPKYIISNKQLRVRGESKTILPEYLYYWFSRPEMVNYIINQNKGASVPLITLGILRSLPVLIPPMYLQQKFADFAIRSTNLIENLEQKNQKLRQTRDLLLPKLISGEIDVEKLEITEEEEAISDDEKVIGIREGAIAS
ncbi:MAG: restriction endonuclease subunit S [Scytolyngbya sp. HA4215-MV1]|jgi:type I restriction enzyme S subunit|nr:restriction endonuclease subunit S [Scytolyngbya sp. HA4215-MV1]